MNLDERLENTLACLLVPQAPAGEIHPGLEESHAKLDKFLSVVRMAVRSIETVLQAARMSTPEECSSSQSLRTILYCVTWHHSMLARTLLVVRILPFEQGRVREIEKHVEFFAQAAQDLSLYVLSGESFSPEAEFYQLSSLTGQQLKIPFGLWAEPDDSAFIARCIELPQVYGCGDTKEEALAMLTREIESLWSDLQEGGELSSEFSSVKKLLLVATTP